MSREPNEPATATIARLTGAADRIGEPDSEEEVYRRTLTEIADLVEYDASSVCIEEDGRIVPKAAVPIDPRWNDYYSPGEGIVGRTIREGETFLIDDVRDHPAAKPTDGRFRSALSVPLGETGALQVIATETGAFDAADREVCRLVTTQAATAIDRVEFETALRSERDRFAALFENVPDAALQYAVEDGRRVVEAVNTAFVDTFDVEAGTVVDSPVESAFADDGPREAAVDDDGTVTEVERETGGGTRRFHLRNVPVSEDERRRGYLIYTDIEELKRREEELRRQNERLDEFASVVSHDLRNPLSVAKGCIEGLDGEEAQLAERSLERMETIITDMLAMARGGKAVVDPGSTPLARIARRAWDQVESGEATLQVETDRRILADGNRLQEVFENLFRNAIEHGGEGVTVVVRSVPGGFVVDDDGVGIEPDDRDTVFELGYTTYHEGSGLGLAIVEEIASAHGWEVAVSENNDGGARFVFTGVEPA